MMTALIGLERLDSGSEMPRRASMGLVKGNIGSTGEMETGRFRRGAGHVSLA